MTSSLAVSAAGLTVKRGGRNVLHGIDVAVPRGTVTGLLGPSGCGKTTLMRAIVGSQANVTGTLEVLGLPAGTPQLRKRVGYATQAASVYEDLSVRENLRYFARVLGQPDAEADRVMARVGLEEFARRRVDSLSGGQRGRVSLGAALMGSPELLVLDEPTVGLDPVLREELWRIFRALAADGATLLVSSHVMDEALRCDQLLLMREGEILLQATPDELLQRTGARDPESAFLQIIEQSSKADRADGADRADRPDHADRPDRADREGHDRRHRHGRHTREDGE